LRIPVTRLNSSRAAAAATFIGLVVFGLAVSDVAAPATSPPAPTTAATPATPPPTPVIALLAGKAEERTVVFNDGDGRGRLAALNLPLTVPKESKRAVTVRFFPTSIRAADSKSLPVKPDEPKTFSRGRVAVWLAGEPSLIGARTATRRGVLAVRFGLAAGQRPSVADGVLLVASGSTGVAPLVLPVVGSGPSYKLSPSPATLTMEHDPLSTADNSSGFKLRSVGAGVAGARLGRGAEALLRHGDDTAVATLTWGKPRVADGLGVGTIAVTDPGPAGKYKGDLVIEPASGQSVSLPIEVNVRHRFFLLFVTVAAAALLGGFFTALYGRRRRRELVRSALKDEVERYEALRDADARQTPNLSEGLYSPLAYGAGERFPTGQACEQLSDDAGEVARLYCAVNAAKSEAELDVATEQAQVVVAEFRRWGEVRRGARNLRRALPAAAQTSGIIRQQTNDLLALTFAAPPDAALAEEVMARLARQMQVLRAFAPAHSLWSRLAEPERRRLARYDPTGLYEAADPEPDRDAAETYRLLAGLGLAERVLAGRDAAAISSYRALNENARPDDPLSELVERSTLGILGHASFDRPVRREDVREGDRRSAASIRGRLKRWDWALGIATALLTLLIYSLGAYNETWGSSKDYATAFGAGFFGQVAVGTVALNWDAFPPLRSYRLAALLEKATPTKKAPAESAPAANA